MEKSRMVAVNSQDLEMLQKISRKTFSESFSEGNTPENLNKYLDLQFSIGNLSDEINHPNSEFYFIFQGDQLAGYLKLNYGTAQTELKGDSSIEIERIYVLKEHQGKKLGQAMLDHAIHIAKRKNAEFIWLGVWEKNLKAIEFYRKNGFIEFDRHIFVLGDEPQTDLMMKLNLK
jgi:ribosomal protein S18 acetylase RimI-like enzyme